MVGTKDVLEGAIESLSGGGTLVSVGGWPGVFRIDVNPATLKKQIVLTGNRYASRQDISESLELVRRGLLKPVILQTFPLEEANKAHELVDQMKLIGRTAIIVSE